MLLRQPRLKDIADGVGCSIAVASHVVNGSTGNISCSPELRDRILRKARELRYFPHYASRVLRSRRARALGVHLPPRADGGAFGPEQAQVLAGAAEACRAAGYDLVLLPAAPEDPAGPLLGKLVGRRVDGLLLFCSAADDPWLRRLVEADADAVAVGYDGALPLETVRSAPAGTGDPATPEALRAIGADAVRRLLERFESRLAELPREPRRPQPVPPTAALLRGRRGRRPSAARAAIAAESEILSAESPPSPFERHP